MNIVSRTTRARAAMTLALIVGAMSAIGGSVVAQLDNPQKPAAHVSGPAVAIRDEVNFEANDPTIQDSEVNDPTIQDSEVNDPAVQDSERWRG